MGTEVSASFPFLIDGIIELRRFRLQFMSNSIWSPTTNDRVLIEHCLKGQESAWEALITKYKRLIYAVCNRNALQATECDDVFGKVCLLLLQHLTQLKDQERLSAWLITTTNRECWLYKSKRLPTSTSKGSLGENKDEAEEKELVDFAALPEEILIRLETQQKVRECFLELSPHCQQLLWELFYNPEEPSYNQISNHLNMPVASIGPKRSRCLEKLRAKLEKLRLI
jgi:RNA polymerase sigma factor (sigma-70 family)